MNRSADWFSKSIMYLTAGLFYAAALLRALLNYWTSLVLFFVLALLAFWLFLFTTETLITRRWRWYFAFYLPLQCVLILALLAMTNSADYFAILFCLLSMQIMQRFNSVRAWIGVGSFSLIMLLPFAARYGIANGTAFTLIYTAGNVLLAFYSRALRRAQAARAHNESLVRELEKTNRQLELYSIQREKLAAARERNRLARDLHDAATQTIFSMTLATQSALLLLDRDPSRVGVQLERLHQLAQSALSEMRTLISELRPKMSDGGLANALREHLAKGQFSDTISMSFQVDGDQALTSAEEQGLFRIAQEALNNIVKHARASHVRIRLHLCEPFSIEIQDDGCGFDLGQARNPSQVGLSSMRERAVEIGWDLQIISSPGTGTRIRADKLSPKERSA